ncbi:MAG TPA: type II toxin-antitoxin system VapC family toxin [Acidimicrobiia bacterium]
MRLYVDSSALVKLVQRESESSALQKYIRRHRADRLTVAALARVEVVRAVATAGGAAVAKARRQLARCELIVLDRSLLDRAATIAPGQLRSLDAIHLAAASALGADLRALVAYDERLLAAADSLGLPTARPD